MIYGRSYERQFERDPGSYFSLELMVSNGPHDFEWQHVDNFPNFEDAYGAMKKMNSHGFSARIVHCNEYSMSSGEVVEEGEGV